MAIGIGSSIDEDAAAYDTAHAVEKIQIKNDVLKKSLIDIIKEGYDYGYDPSPEGRRGAQMVDRLVLIAQKALEKVG